MAIGVAAAIFGLSRPSAPWLEPGVAVQSVHVQLTVPVSWSVHAFENNLGLATHRGVILSNVAHEWHYPKLPQGSSTSAWDMRGLPEDAVVVEVSRAPRFILPCKRSSDYPLAIPTAAPTRNPPSYGAPPNYFVSACVEGDPSFGVFVYFFPKASPLDRMRAWQVVESIEPLTG